MEIIHLSPQDWPAYKAIRLEALQTDPQAFGSVYAESALRPDASWRERLEEAAEGKRGWLLFARQDGRITGLIGAYRLPDEDSAEIVSVYVSPGARGRGAAAALMEAVLAELAATGLVRRATITVNVEQAAAVRLYLRFGFTITGQQEALMGDGLVHTEYRMEKRLAE